MFAVDEFWTSFGQHFAATIIYVLLGLLFFAVKYGIIARMSPYSMRKEIEEEKNVALAVIIGAVIIGIAIIIAATVHG